MGYVPCGLLYPWSCTLHLQVICTNVQITHSFCRSFLPFTRLVYCFTDHPWHLEIFPTIYKSSALFYRPSIAFTDHFYCLHFSLFVNDLPVSLTRSEVMLYADDTTIYLSDSNSLKERLSQDLVALSTWIADNGLTMNTQKTQFMVLSKRGRDKEVEKL